jgi:hypothetical protein
MQENVEAVEIDGHRFTFVFSCLGSEHAEITVQEVIDLAVFSGFGNVVQEAIDQRLRECLPAHINRHTTIARYATGVHNRRTLHFNQQIAVASRTFPFEFEFIRSDSDGGERRIGNFRLTPPLPESTEPVWRRTAAAVVLEQDICDALAGWYGAPLETISDPCCVFFSPRHYRYGHSSARVVVDEVCYYFWMRRGADYAICTVLTPLVRRDQVLEEQLLEALRPACASGLSEPVPVVMYSRNGQRWELQI